MKVADRSACKNMNYELEKKKLENSGRWTSPHKTKKKDVEFSYHQYY